MTLPQYSSLDHWYGSRADRQVSALSTRIDDCSGKGKHGSRIGTTISVVAGWYNLGEQAGGNSHGIQPPTLSLAGGGSYSWCARVRRSTSSNWGDHYHVVQGATGTSAALNCLTFWNLDHPGSVFTTAHNGGASGSDWTIFTGGAWQYSPSAWVVDASHTMVCTYNASSTTMRTYVDGVLAWTQTGVPANTGAGNLAWFAWDGFGGQSWGHESDSVLFWPGVVLTDGSVSNGATAGGEVAQALAYLDVAVSSVTPSDNATGISTTDDLVLTCNVAPTLGSGNLYVKRTSDNSTFQTIATAACSVSGSTVVVPHSTFAGSTGYYVTWDAYFIAGVGAQASTTAWNFTTVSSGTTQDLGGTAAGTAAGSGNLSDAVPLAGSASGSASGSGALADAVTLGGTAAGLAGGSGDLADSVPLGGTSVGLSGGSGVLSDAAPLGGTSAGSAGGSGALDDAVQLGGTATGSAGGAGTLADAAGLGGTSAGSSDGSGSLADSAHLAGTAAGSGGGSGVLSDVVPLGGQADGSAGGSGSLSTSGDIELGGLAAGTGGGSGTLSDAAALDGTAAGVGGAAGSLGLGKGLGGTAQGQAGGEADLSDAVSLGGVAAGLADGTAHLFEEGTAIVHLTVAHIPGRRLSTSHTPGFHLTTRHG